MKSTSSLGLELEQAVGVANEIDNKRHLANHQPPRRLVHILIRPAIKFALKSGLLLQDFIQIAKEVYVELAEANLAKIGSRPNVSRISVMTGVHRQDVTKSFRDRESLTEIGPEALLSRVISTWAHTKRFQNSQRQPRLLSYDGAGSEFSRLVESLSTTVNPGTVLFELLRNGAARKTPRGLKLVRATLAVGTFPDQALGLLSQDAETLINVVEQNIASQNRPNHAHYRTSYDNLYLRDLPKIREWTIEHARKFHRELREYLSGFDADYTLKKAGGPAGGKITITSFSLTEPFDTNADQAIGLADSELEASPSRSKKSRAG